MNHIEINLQKLTGSST